MSAASTGPGRGARTDLDTVRETCQICGECFRTEYLVYTSLAVERMLRTCIPCWCDAARDAAYNAVPLRVLLAERCKGRP